MDLISRTAKTGIKLLMSGLSVVVLLFVVLYLLGQILDAKGVIYPIVGLWALLSYIILPRTHRLLSKLYLPDYYIGRTRTGDGFYGDAVNVAFIGDEKQLHEAMESAGWVKADKLSFRSTLSMINASIRKRSYQQAPVSSLFLFGHKQLFCYQQEVNGNPRVRHHVRFWKVPKNWWLPGGHEADWLAAATFDKSLGFSIYTGQITHKITDDTDAERDYVVESVADTKYVKSVEVVEKFSTAFRSRNGGGDHIITDGAMPFVHLEKPKF